MARPRNSVLYMFDPLQSPSTPRRDSSSSDLSASDKENDSPCGDVTMFFNRICAVQRQEDVQVSTPKGKLIDIGDTPEPLGAAWDGGEHDGSDADGEQSESDMEACAVLSPPRRPLAEIDADRTPRPLGNHRPAKAPMFGILSPPVQGPEPLPAMLVPAPQTSPLADVVNSINFSSMSLTEQSRPLDPSTQIRTEDYGKGCASLPSPEINVCAPETPTAEDYELSTSEAQYGKPTTMAVSHLRPTSSLTQLSSDDPRRASVDLYSSFHLQMQSADMSFDLLNDKITFFGQDSFWSAGDDAMEFDETGLPPALKAKMEKLINFTPPVEYKEPVFSPPTKHAPSPRTPYHTSPTTETAINVPLPLSPVDTDPSSHNITPPRYLQLTHDEPPSPPTSPVDTDAPSLLLEPEPLPPSVAQPSVPALRIIKKTFKVVRHQSVTGAPSKATTSTQDEPESVILANRRPSLSRPTPAPVPAPSRPLIRGVQRPPAGMIAGGVVIGQPSHRSTSGSGSVSSAPSSARVTAAVAPSSRFAGIQRPSLGAKAAPRTASGTRPVAPSTRTMSMAPQKAPAPSFLRPPSRIGALGAASGLPKPASRLPGPSSISRTASSSAIGSGVGTAASRARATGRF